MRHMASREMVRVWISKSAKTALEDMCQRTKGSQTQVLSMMVERFAAAPVMERLRMLGVFNEAELKDLVEKEHLALVQRQLMEAQAAADVAGETPEERRNAAYGTAGKIEPTSRREAALSVMDGHRGDRPSGGGGKPKKT